jgi:hypothetical protein
MTGSVIDVLKEQAMQRVETLKNHVAMGELLKLHSAMNNLEDVEGLPRTNLSQLFGLDASEIYATVLVMPGEFYGKTPLVAAKEFLLRKKKPSTLDEIFEALRTGSCDPGPRDKLGVSLARSTFQFVKIGEDRYGLLDWYPDVRDKRKASLSGPKRKTAASVTADNNVVVEAPATADETA